MFYSLAETTGRSTPSFTSFHEPRRRLPFSRLPIESLQTLWYSGRTASAKVGQGIASSEAPLLNSSSSRACPVS